MAAAMARTDESITFAHLEEVLYQKAILFTGNFCGNMDIWTQS